jgi:hypothetical protein
MATSMLLYKRINISNGGTRMHNFALDRRSDGAVSIFQGGRQYKRVPGNNGSYRWLEGSREVEGARARRLERAYEHPKEAKQVLRFPRLELTETIRPIKDFFDIPLTTSFRDRNLRWVVNGLIPEGELILIAAPPASFKSFLVEALAAAVSAGHDFLGRTTKRTPVLLMDRDNPLHIVSGRLKKLKGSEGLRFRIWGNWVGDPPAEIADSRLEEIARKHHPLIIFDSFVRFHQADENSAKEMAIIMAALRRLTTAGATVILIHHSSKQNPSQKQRSNYRGSSDIHAAVDVAFNISVDRKTSPPTLTLNCFKHRAIEEFEITIKADLGNGRFEVLSDSSVPASDKIVETLKALILAERGLCQEDLIKRSELPEHKIRNILRAGENIHWNVKKLERKKKAYYPI